MFTEIEVIRYKGLAIRHIVSDTGLELVFAHTEDTGERVVTKKVRPAIGGCRHNPGMLLMAACEEVYGLATEMDAKTKRAGINGAGAKTVVVSKEKDTQTLYDLGEFVEYLHYIGIPYIISVDGGFTPADMTVIARKTRWVSHCNPSPDTARGVASAISAYADMLHTDPRNLSVFIRGLGAVGTELAMILRWRKFVVFGCDQRLHAHTRKNLELVGVQIIGATDDYFPKAYIYAPCTLGGEISDSTIPLIKEAGIHAVIGSANHQLKDGEVNATQLHLAGILWAVDHLVNRCGLLRVAVEFPDLFHVTLEDFERAVAQTGVIIRKMFEMSLRLNKPMMEVEQLYFAGMKTAA